MNPDVLDDVLERYVDQGDVEEVALHRVTFCLNQIEKIVKNDILYYELFPLSFYGNSRLTMEEVIGALVACEQALTENEKDLICYE